MTPLQQDAHGIALAEWFATRALPGSPLWAHERRMTERMAARFTDTAKSSHASPQDGREAIENAQDAIAPARHQVLTRN